MARTFSVILACLSFIAETALGFFGVVGSGQRGSDDVDTLFREIPLAETVYVVPRAALTREQHVMLVFLQGITAKTAAAIYIDNGGVGSEYIAQYQARYVDTGRSNVTFDTSVTDPWVLVERFRDSFGGKFVTFDMGENDPGINLASTIAGVESWLGVPAGLREQALEHGLTEARDVRGLPGTFTEQERAIFLEYKDRLNKRLLSHFTPNAWAGRDLGIANGTLFFFTRDYINAPSTFLEGRGLRHEVYRWADPAALLLGFWASGDEIVFIDDMSRYGKTMVPSHSRSNGTVTMALEGSASLTQPWRSNEALPKAKAVEGKHTIAFYVTDGDNITVVDGSGGGVCAPYNTMLGPRCQSGDTFKMTYSIAPLLGRMAPFVMEYFYDNNDGPYGLGEYDSYIGCTSGMSIINASSFPRQTLESFAKMTADTMERTDIHVITPIDQLIHNPMFLLRHREYLAPFAQYDSIKGGVWQIDPPKYKSGRGLVVWANDKPWVAVRTALWAPVDEAGHDSVSAEWLDGIAASLNQRSGDPHTIDGYSVIAIQPWSIHYSDIQYLVSKLDMDRVQIVFVEELIDMVTENVPHRFAFPKLELDN